MSTTIDRRTAMGYLLRLPRAERVLLLRTALLVPAVALGVRLLPFSYVHTQLARLARRSSRRHAPLELPRVLWAVANVSRYLPGSSCLVRALSAQFLLEQQGISTDLRIGFAATERGGLEGHAWLEHEGEVVMGGKVDLRRFTPLTSLPPASMTPPLTHPADGRRS